MSDPRVSLRSEPGEPWAVDYDRERNEIFLNAGYFDAVDPSTNQEHADAIADIGAALIQHLRRHPGAGDLELVDVARAARPDHAPEDYYLDY